MVFRYRLWLLLLAALLFPLPAAAQMHPPKQSHRELAGELDMSDPQGMMSERLGKLKELHSLQDHMQGLLHDPQFLGSLNQLSEADKQRLRENLLQGKGLQHDPNWNRLLQQAQSMQRLDEHQVEMLRRWAERADLNPAQLGQLLPNGSAPPPQAPTPQADAANGGSSLPPLAPPEPSWFDRMQDETTKWAMDQLDDMGGDVVSAFLELGNTEQGGPIAELLREMQKPDFAGGTLNEPLMGLAQSLPKMGELLNEQRGLWDEMRSIFRDTRTPSLPNLSVSKPAASTDNESVWTPMLLVLSLPILLLFLVRRMKARTNAGSGRDAWHLGSWPIAPNEVATRRDLVLAFEYVALLRLGVSAGACHHRALAERLGTQDGDNPARRLAADMLAWLYEKARYAPVGETLSQDELHDARNALCLLAGVTSV